MASLASALQRIEILETEVVDLKSKQDVIAVDVGEQSGRLDLMEQERNAGEDDWWKDDTQQDEPHFGDVKAEGDESLRDTQLNATMHTPPNTARGNLQADAHQQALRQHALGGALQHLSQPPAAAG